MHRDCIIVFKNNGAIALRSTNLTVQNDADGKCIVVWDDDVIMCVADMAEVRTVIFADVSDTKELIAELTKAVNA